MRKRNFWPLLILANVLCLCVLSFYRTSPAAPGKQIPFVNPAEQREIMIEELKQLNRLLREQNTLLSSGKLAVIVAPQPAR
ncbi:MAG: hypothetical protein GTO04_19140 [Planctomycetales bacterium]|nr:hypothetical protein [Planctomycetales bacterium]